MEAFHNLELEKQHRILNAALKEFTLRGFDDASTNVITQAAEISKGALFHYFGNKAKLYDYLIAYVTEQIQTEMLDQMPDTTDLIELFYFYSVRKTEMAKLHPLLFEFLYRVMQEAPDHPEYQRVIEQSQAMMGQMMFGNIDTSNFREGIDLAQAIEICTWLTVGFARKYSMQHAKLDPEHLLDATDELFRIMRIMLYKE